MQTLQHPQHQQLAEAHDKAQAERFQTTGCSQCGGTFGPANSGFSHCSDHIERFVPTPAMWAGMVADIKKSQEQRVEVNFMDVDLVCHGTYTPNTDGFCDNGGFEISKALHKGEDIQDLLTFEYMERLEWLCFDKHERMLKEAADE